MLAVALSVTESARVERELRTPAANRLSAAVASDDQERGSRVLCAVTLCMIDDRQDDKVCRSVVLLVAVDVVYVLVAAEISAKHSRHDVTVLKNVSAVHSDADVTVAADEPPASPVAVVGSCPASCWVAALPGAVAVLATLESARVRAELLAAPLTRRLHASSKAASCDPIVSRIAPGPAGLRATTTGS